jgi:hypothetical protein
MRGRIGEKERGRNGEWEKGRKKIRATSTQQH